ncbi:MAG: TRAP transporter small permease [Desulfobacteraceae bacterium]|nr:TRAP transporter small permease [Desulfobacteraceae bacterium]
MFFEILNKIVRAAMIFVLSVITVMVSLEVILRYFFGATLYVTEEFTRYSMVWMVFLGSSLAVRENAHNRVELFVNFFKPKTRAYFNLVAHCAFAFFLVFLVYEGSIALSYQFEQIIPTLNISMFWFYLALPTGGVLMFLNLLPKIWEDALIVIGRKEAVEEVFEIPVIDGGLS